MFDQPDKAAGEEATEKSDPLKNMSVTMREAISGGVVTGLMQSIATYLVGTMSDTEEIEKKLKVVANAFVAGKDLRSEDISYMTTDYVRYIRNAQAVENMPVCCEAYASWYQAISSLFDDDRVRNKWFDLSATGYTNEEREIISGYNQAQAEYWKAQNRFTNYVSNLNRFVMNQLLMKYGTTLQQTVPDWYKRILKCAGSQVAEAGGEPEPTPAS